MIIKTIEEIKFYDAQPNEIVYCKFGEKPLGYWEAFYYDNHGRLFDVAYVFNHDTINELERRKQ